MQGMKQVQQEQQLMVLESGPSMSQLYGSLLNGNKQMKMKGNSSSGIASSTTASSTTGISSSSGSSSSGSITSSCSNCYE
jgi:hypothetical protein